MQRRSRANAQLCLGHIELNQEPLHSSILGVAKKDPMHNIMYGVVEKYDLLMKRG